jgi:hypothetical protein
MVQRVKAGGEREFRAGLRELLRHRPDLALRSLRLAVDSCPAAKPARLSERLYWLSIVLRRLDRPELAIKSLASAQKLRPRGLARSAYGHLINEYGMPRRASHELDDFHAFYAIHVCRFLAGRQDRRFRDHAEKDDATRLIALAWRELRGSGRLAGLDTAAKLELFRGWSFEFPSFLEARRGPQAVRPRAGCSDPLPVDFRRGRAIGADDRCSCGSGLAWRLCCGRITSPCELKSDQ